MRSPLKIPCATPAWGAWSLWTTSHSSHRGNTKIGPALEVTTCCLQGKCGVEIRIESVNNDNSHSLGRISHGLNKLVTNLNHNEQETSEMQFEEYALKLNACDFASRSKANAKPQRRNSASKVILREECQRVLFFSFDSVWEGDCGLHAKSVCCPTAHSHTRCLILSASDGIWNMLFSTYSHTFKRVRSNGFFLASAICSNCLHRLPN